MLTYPDLQSRIRDIVEGDEAALGRWLTLSHWCDDTLGTQIVRQINDQLIKWCEAFLDEGHATWAMPERERVSIRPGKRSPLMNGRPAASRTASARSPQLSEYPEDALLESLDALGIPPELRQDYLSLQLTALPGWAGFIKWRGEERTIPGNRPIRPVSCSSWPSASGTPRAGAEGLPRRTGHRRSLRRRDGLYAQTRPEEYYLRRQRVAGRLPALYAEEVDRLAHQRGNGVEGGARSLPDRSGSTTGGGLGARRGAKAAGTVERRWRSIRSSSSEARPERCNSS